MSDNQRLEATVYGRVQGVSFRYYTQQKARQLGLTGWVANHPDSSVRLTAEGPRPALDELAAFLQQGPPAARVSRVDTTWDQASGEWHSFGVRFLGNR
ncbi:MAG: acylphosphatase [Chloroflexota bacterium]|jgi:acylphosphatase